MLMCAREAEVEWVPEALGKVMLKARAALVRRATEAQGCDSVVDLS
jgi:hypothetical protein